MFYNRTLGLIQNNQNGSRIQSVIINCINYNTQTLQIQLYIYIYSIVSLVLKIMIPIKMSRIYQS